MLAGALASGACLGLRELDFCNARFRDEDVAALADMVEARWVTSGIDERGRSLPTAACLAAICDGTYA